MVITMIDIAITRLSSKGQIVIPSEMRKNFNIAHFPQVNLKSESFS